MIPRGRMFIFSAGIFVLASVTGVSSRANDDVAAFSREQLDFFEARIRPILVETCHECHGPDKQESGLRLDSRAGLLKGADTGPVVIPGDPESSRLVQAVRYTGEIKMPEDMKLFPEEIEALTEWVRMGAPWPDEQGPITSSEPVPEPDRDTLWAFHPIRRPELPATRFNDWIRNDVDRFVAARLEQAGLEPSPTADRRTLIRRLSFDLIGLPPSADEVETFVNDDSPDAYERLVERLLASPRYGERWARHWLDVARYSDTKGYVFNQDRFFPYSFTYRDYVIRAFNEDLPYDDFIMHQLAADQLDLGEDRTPLAALGFLTLGRRFLEQIDDIVDDRIDVVTRGLLGLTVSCARCHDHKFDPIPSSDYYALYGVFRSSHEPDEWPLIEEPDDSDPLYQEFVRILDEKRAELDRAIEKEHVELLTHARERLHEYLQAVHDVAGLEEEAFLRLAKERELNQKLLKQWVTFLENVDADHPVLAPWLTFAELEPEQFAEQAESIANRFAGNTDEDVTLNPLVAELFDGDAPQSLEDVAQRYGELFTRIDRKWQALLAARVQVATQLDAPVAIPDALPDAESEAVRDLLYGVDSPANIPRAQVEEYSETRVRERIGARRRDVDRHSATHPGRPRRAMALYDREKPYDPYVFLRGKPENHGEAVERRFISALTDENPEPFENGSGRLELAQAIVDPDNPLTARVFVNRVWMHHFGEPLVSTPSDFGTRSDPPTHPDLLDYLAGRFIDGGWSVKDLHRVIVLSNTYRQQSAFREDAYAADPENRLLWRQNRRRLDFEAMRDAILAVSGTLDSTMYGPAVDVFDEPYTGRRTVYGLVERQNLPGTFRTFDFASPDTHSPQRYETVVPQQALFLMNSPFVISQARALAARPELAAAADDNDRVRRMFQLAFQREPNDSELASVREFLSRQFDNGPEPPPPSAWSYGYGQLDEAVGRVTSFTEFPVFQDNRWQAGETFPDSELGHVSITDQGGHPGRTSATSTIHRWTVPYDGTVHVSGRLRHMNERGDGVHGYLVSSRDGILGRWEVLNGFEDTDVESIVVHAGEILDFVVAPGAHDSYDSYKWAQHVAYEAFADAHMPGRAEWEAQADFEGPRPAPPEPLDRWEQIAQTLLCSNEFMYVD